MVPSKACPVVLRDVDTLEVLAFAHPLAGLQLVKGTIEPRESPADAALRELREESGLAGRVVGSFGYWQSGHLGQVWSFHLCEVAPPPPIEWVHRTEDDGGLDFRFFWHPLCAEPSELWHPVFRRALAHLRGLISYPSLKRTACRDR